MASLREFVRKLKADCSTVESTVLHLHCVTPEQCAAVRPGGAENRDRSVNGWLSYYRWLHRQHAIAVERPNAPGKSGTESYEGLALDALRGRAERVPLIAPVTRDGAPVTAVTLYPKSMTALIHCHVLSLRMGYLAAHVRALRGSKDPGDADVVQLAATRMDALQRRWLWIVTSEGPRLPYADDDPDGGVVPAWLSGVDVLDMHRIVKMFQQVHASRLIALDKIVSADPDARASHTAWSIFAATAAEELGISTRELMEEIDFPAVVARVRLTASAKREAMEEAKRRAKDKRGRE